MLSFVRRYYLNRIYQLALADGEYRLAYISALERACDEVRDMERNKLRVVTFENRLIQYFREEAGLKGRGLP